MYKYKAIILGNVHTDKNQCEYINELIKYLDPDQWMFGLEDFENKSLSDIKQRSENLLDKNEKSYQESLKHFGLAIEPNSMNLTKLLLCEDIKIAMSDPTVKKLHSSKHAMELINNLSIAFMMTKPIAVKHQYITSLMNSEFETYPLEKEVSDSKMQNVMESIGAPSLQNKGQLEPKMENLDDLEESDDAPPGNNQNFFKTFNEEREKYYLEKIKTICQEKKKNIIVLLGIAHLPPIKNLIKDTDDIEYHFYAISPSSATSAVGTLEAVQDANKELLKISEENDIKLISDASSFAKFLVAKSCLFKAEKMESEREHWMSFFSSKIVNSEQKKASKANIRVTAEFSVLLQKVA